MTDKAYEREVAHLRQVINNAKVVVTLTAAIAATFVAGTLQVERATHWDHAAAALMLVTLGLSFWLIALPPKPHVVELDYSAYHVVKKRTCRAHWLLVGQIIFSGLSCAAATIGLLWPSSWQ